MDSITALRSHERPTASGASPSDPARLRLTFVVALSLAALAAGCVGPASAPAASGTTNSGQGSTNPGQLSGTSPQTFHAAGLSFQIPLTWHSEAMDEPFHYERLLGYVGDGTWKLICPPGAQPGEFNTCTVSTDLANDTVAVRISENQGPPTPGGQGAVDWALTSGESASPLTVGGLPAAVQTVDAPADELGLRWTLTVPGYPIRTYTLTALIRGPDFATVRGELNTLIESVTITPVAAPSG